MICVALKIWFLQTGSSKRILHSCNFKSDWPGFQCLTTEKERETVKFGWHLVSWRNKQRENKVHGEVLRATAKIDQVKDLPADQKFLSFSISLNLFLSLCNIHAIVCETVFFSLVCAYVKLLNKKYNFRWFQWQLNFVIYCNLLYLMH